MNANVAATMANLGESKIFRQLEKVLAAIKEQTGGEAPFIQRIPISESVKRSSALMAGASGTGAVYE